MVPKTGISAGGVLNASLHLLGDVAQRVGRALAVELVDGDELGEVEHVDLLELARGAELRRHDVDRHVDERHDRGVALANARGLDDDEVEPGRLAGRHDVRQRLADLAAEVARGQRAHEHARPVLPRADRVHANAVAEQRAATLAPRRIDADDGDAQRVALVQAQAADELVGQARLAGAAGAGDADDRDVRGLRSRRERGLERFRTLARLERGDEPRQRAPGRLRVALHRRGVGRCLRRQVEVGAHHHLADHAREAHALAVLGAVDARHAVVLQLADLGRDDDAAAAAEDLDVLAAALAQQIDHVLEVLDVPALVAADRDALHVLLQGGGHDLVDRAVVAEVDHLRAHALQDAAHDVDRRIVAVEQARRGDEAHLVRRSVVGEREELGGQVGHRVSPWGRRRAYVTWVSSSERSPVG
jgi:hypothetical protein